MSQPGLPVVVDLNPPRTKASLVFGTLLLLVLGAGGLYGAFTGDVQPSTTGTRVAAGIIGGIFFLIGLLMATTLRTTTRDRSLVIEPGGIRYVDPRGRHWAAAWNELAVVQLVTMQKASRVRTSTASRLILVPSDPGFGARHPTMSTFAGRWGAPPNGFGMPLGTVGGVPAQVDQGLRMYAGPRYQGADNRGVQWGFKGYV